MANIKGFQLKNIKTPIGREGYGCLASIYLHGKKVGNYEDYGDGSFGNYNLPKEAEEEIIKIAFEYAKSNPDKDWIEFYSEEEYFERAKENLLSRYPFLSEKDITVNTVYIDVEYLVNKFLFLQAVEKVFKKNPNRGYRAVGIKGSEIVSFSESWSNERILKVSKIDNIEKVFFELEDFDIK